MNRPLSSSMATKELMELGGVPVDRMAWRVLQPGEHYERPEKLTELCFAACPPTVDRKVNMGNHGGSPQTKTIDLRGMRVGRLVVMGYWGRRLDGREKVGAARVERKKRGEQFGLRSSNGRSDQLWVCRCLCGLFTIKTAKSLMKVKPPEVADRMRCEACNNEGLANAWKDKPRGRNFDRAPDPY